MDVTTIQMAREQASEQYELYREAVKKRREPYLHDLKVLYGAMRTGKVVLDVWQSFKEAGLDGNGDPKIAIAPADATQIRFQKMDREDARWSAVLCPVDGSKVHWSRQWRAHRTHLSAEAAGDVFLPRDTYSWTYPPPATPGGYVSSTPARALLETRVPVVPAIFLPPHGLSNYHILWEVEKWDLVTPPRDPLLLKRVSPNMFVVLAAWELTDVERAVLRGRIA